MESWLEFMVNRGLKQSASSCFFKDGIGEGHPVGTIMNGVVIVSLNRRALEKTFAILERGSGGLLYG